MTASLSNADDSGIPDVLRPITAELKLQLQAVAGGIQTRVEIAVGKLEADEDVNAFIAYLREQRKIEDQQIGDSVNAAFDKAAALGEEHPDLQQTILFGMNIVQNVVSSFSGLVSDLVEKVVASAADVVKKNTRGVEEASAAFSTASTGVLSAL